MVAGSGEARQVCPMVGLVAYWRLRLALLRIRIGDAAAHAKYRWHWFWCDGAALHTACSAQGELVPSAVGSSFEYGCSQVFFACILYAIRHLAFGASLLKGAPIDGSTCIVCYVVVVGLLLRSRSMSPISPKSRPNHFLNHFS